MVLCQISTTHFSFWHNMRHMMLRKYSGTEILPKRQTVMAEMEREIKAAIESKGFHVVKVYMSHIDSLNKDTMKSLTDSIMKSVGYQLQYRILKEKEKINTIEALTNRMVVLKQAQLANFQTSERLKLGAEIAKIKKRQIEIELDTLHITEWIEERSKQAVRVIDMGTIAMRTKEEIKNILASQVTLNEVNDILMAYYQLLASHNHSIRSIAAKINKTRSMIRSKAEANKIEEQTRVQKDVYSRFNSSISFDANDINTMVWLDLLEKITGIKRNGTEDIKVPFDAFTPKA